MRSELLKLKYSYKHFLYNSYNLCRTKLWPLLVAVSSSSLHPCKVMRREKPHFLQAYSTVLNPRGPFLCAGAVLFTGAPNVTLFCTNYICCIRNICKYISVWRIQTAHAYLICTIDTNCRSYHTLWNFVITTDRCFNIGTRYCLMVVYFYRNSPQQCPYYSYVFDVVHLIVIIEYIKHSFV